jgi:prevent-host-death family protein
MNTSTVSSRMLNQDVSSAKKAARAGPVIITDRGRPSHVLMTYDDYLSLSGTGRSLAKALAMPGLSDIAFDPPRNAIGPREIDLD